MRPLPGAGKANGFTLSEIMSTLVIVGILSAIAPALLTVPKVGLRPVTPFTVDGETMDPQVSDPMEKATSPAAVADPGPAELPLDPWSVFQGFLVFPPYHVSPQAKAPSVNFAINTAPAFSSFSITVAVSSMNWSL